MTAEEFLYGFEHGKIGLSFNELKRLDDVNDIVDFLEENGFSPWDDSSMREYIQTRFIEDTGYGYMSCDVGGKYDVTAFRDANPYSSTIIDWRLLIKLINPEEVSTEEFDSILN